MDKLESCGGTKKSCRASASALFFPAHSALSSVVEHFLHTEALGNTETLEPQDGIERSSRNYDLCPDFSPRKRVQSRPLTRIARGLYRNGSNGTIYLCRKQNGKNVWKSLQTTDRTRAMAISALLNYSSAQNGNHEVVVLPDVTSNTGTSRPRQSQAAKSDSPAPTPPPAQVPDTSPERSGDPVTLNALVERFKGEWNHLAPATRSKLDCHFKVAARYLDFGRNVTCIRLADMRELKSKLLVERKPSTVNDIMFKALAALFNLALEDGIIDRSPLERLKPAIKKEIDREQPTWEQSELIVQEVTKSRSETGLIVGFMQNFGVGQAEIKYLLGEHIDLAGQVIHFRRKKTGKFFDVPIFSHAKEFVEQLKTEGRLERGKPVVVWRNPRKALATACDHLDLSEYEPRALRRCFIVRCLESGVDPRVVAKWQGHSDAKLIFSTYGKHIDAKHEQREAGKLEDHANERSEPNA
jgi:integrase